MSKKRNLSLITTGVALLISLFLAIVSIRLTLYFNFPLIMLIVLSGLLILSIYLIGLLFISHIMQKSATYRAVLSKTHYFILILSQLFVLPFTFLLAQKDDAPGLILFQLIPLILIVINRYLNQSVSSQKKELVLLSLKIC